MLRPRSLVAAATLAAATALSAPVAAQDIPPDPTTTTTTTAAVPPPAVVNPVPWWEWHQTYAHRLPFLVCTRSHETPGRRIHPYDDGYVYPSRNGFHGAYQFTPTTWAGAVTRAGYPYLAWNGAERVSMKYQDLAAIQLVHERGAQPWGGRCAHLLWRQPNGVWAFR